MQILLELIIRSSIKINTTLKLKTIRCKVLMIKCMTTCNTNRFLKVSRAVHLWQVRHRPFIIIKKWAQWNKIKLDNKNNQWSSSRLILSKWKVKRTIRQGRVLRVSKELTGMQIMIRKWQVAILRPEQEENQTFLTLTPKLRERWMQYHKMAIIRKSKEIPTLLSKSIFMGSILCLIWEKHSWWANRILQKRQTLKY